MTSGVGGHSSGPRARQPVDAPGRFLRARLTPARGHCAVQPLEHTERTSGACPRLFGQRFISLELFLLVIAAVFRITGRLSVWLDLRPLAAVRCFVPVAARLPCFSRKPRWRRRAGLVWARVCGSRCARLCRAIGERSRTPSSTLTRLPVDGGCSSNEIPAMSADWTEAPDAWPGSLPPCQARVASAAARNMGHVSPQNEPVTSVRRRDRSRRVERAGRRRQEKRGGAPAAPARFRANRPLSPACGVEELLPPVASRSACVVAEVGERAYGSQCRSTLKSACGRGRERG